MSPQGQQIRDADLKRFFEQGWPSVRPQDMASICPRLYSDDERFDFERMLVELSAVAKPKTFVSRLLPESFGSSLDQVTYCRTDFGHSFFWSSAASCASGVPFLCEHPCRMIVRIESRVTTTHSVRAVSWIFRAVGVPLV